MSPRRTRATRFTNDELKELVMKLQALMMTESSSRHTSQVSASKILKETCIYIKRLHREVDNLSDKLSHLLYSMENNSVDVDILRNLLQR